jgi:hypothetical protein
MIFDTSDTGTLDALYKGLHASSLECGDTNLTPAEKREEM